MFGLAIVAVGLLFLAFSLTYKCLMAKKQRTREAAEVRIPSAAMRRECDICAACVRCISCELLPWPRSFCRSASVQWQSVICAAVDVSENSRWPEHAKRRWQRRTRSDSGTAIRYVMLHRGCVVMVAVMVHDVLVLRHVILDVLRAVSCPSRNICDVTPLTDV